MTKKKKTFNPKITMETNNGGVSFWQNGFWILDASTFLEDNEMEIDTKAFKVIVNNDTNRIVLKAKKWDAKIQRTN